MPASDFVVGGAFKFKGAKDAGIDKKRKKKKKKDADSSEEKTSSQAHDRVSNPTGEDDAKEKDAALKKLITAPAKTKAELDFERRRQERLRKHAADEGPKTHKDRVREFNEKLAAQSDHHDMPRIGPG